MPMTPDQARPLRVPGDLAFEWLDVLGGLHRLARAALRWSRS
jgi:uncharacterized protein (DUF2235 family)